MSTFYPHDVHCPACAQAFKVDVVWGIHITRLPWAREQILEGSFQVFACPACQHKVRVEGPSVYTDFERHQYVAIETTTSGGWQAAKLRHQTIFEDSFEGGPEIAREMGRTFTRRLVFGLGRLREKLMLWDAGLDDYAVEAVKGDLLARLELDHRDTELVLATILDGGHLMFARLPPRPRPASQSAEAVMRIEPIGFETAPASDYRRRSDARDAIAADYPWLGDDWLVDISEGPVFAATGPAASA
jgi:hypothetical protein